MKAKIRAILKRPDESFGHMTNISPKLENLQKIVGGGYVIKPIAEKPGLIVLCHYDLRGLPIRRLLDYYADDCYCAKTLIVCGMKGEDQEFIDIPIEFAEWKELVKKWRGL
jgi:hypothetical protein